MYVTYRAGKYSGCVAVPYDAAGEGGLKNLFVISKNEQRNYHSTIKSTEAIFIRKYSVQDIALFDSYSRDEATPKSDIDILIHFKEPTYNSLCKSFDILQDAFGNITVQLVSRGGTKPQYFEAIKQDLLYA